MGHINIPNSSVVYDNPNQADQSTLVFPPCTVTPGYPPNVSGTLAGAIWMQNGPTAFPQPGTFDPTPPIASPVLFNKQPPALSDGGIRANVSHIASRALLLDKCAFIGGG
jgi:hypothetical protein